MWVVEGLQICVQHRSSSFPKSKGVLAIRTVPLQSICNIFLNQIVAELLIGIHVYVRI